MMLLLKFEHFYPVLWHRRNNRFILREIDERDLGLNPRTKNCINCMQQSPSIIAAQLVKKKKSPLLVKSYNSFPTVFTGTRQRNLGLQWAKYVQAIPSHPRSLRWTLCCSSIYIKVFQMLYYFRILWHSLIILMLTIFPPNSFCPF
jgi:hypothetical protein